MHKVVISICLFGCSIIAQKPLEWLVIRKIAKIVIYDQARVDGSNNHDFPGQRWIPNLVGKFW